MVWFGVVVVTHLSPCPALSTSRLSPLSLSLSLSSTVCPLPLPPHVRTPISSISPPFPRSRSLKAQMKKRQAELNAAYAREAREAAAKARADEEAARAAAAAKAAHGRGTRLTTGVLVGGAR